MTDLRKWLEEQGLSACAEVLEANDVDLDVLPQITDDDLKEIGLSLGNRRRLLAAASKRAQGNRKAPEAAQPETMGDSGEGTREHAPPREAERRQVTVLFCDLAGSTELAQRLDPEKLHEVMRGYQDAVSGPITRFGGFVAKFLGDGVLAYFGWPQAYEDEAERAIHASFEALRAVEHLGEVHALTLKARAGIATGSVIIGDITGQVAREAGGIIGETPNLAARLQGEAKPGQVVVGPLTRRLAGNRFEFDDLGERPLKGYSKPQALWRVIGARSGASRFEAAHDGNALSPFVGREEELSLLLSRWTRAAQGEGQGVLVSGEAGLGKSRILEEFRQRLINDAGTGGQAPEIADYQCSAYQVNAAFHPFIEALVKQARLEPGQDEAERLDRLEAVVTGAGLSLERTALLAALLGLPVDRYPPLESSPLRQKAATAGLLADLLVARSKERPLAILFEDAHWIDASSLELLEELVVRLPETRILLIVTHRPEFDPHWARHGHLTRYSLNRLGADEGRAIAERATGGKSLPSEVLEHVLAHTDGVPLFIEELTKAIIESDSLEARGDRYELTGPLARLEIPSTLQGSLMARIDRLSAVKSVIQAAACIGRQFSEELLRQILPLSDAELEDGLDKLVQAELVFRRPAGGENLYSFKHALIQDAAYDSLLSDRRRSLHGKLAEAMATQAEPDDLELARHLAAADRPLEAAETYLAAGRHSLQVSALPEAAGALELGLEQADKLPENEERDALTLSLRLALGAARMAQFGWPHPTVSTALEPAYDLAVELGKQAALGPIFFGLWVHYQTRTEFPTALAWLDKLDAALERHDSRELQAVRDMTRGCQHFWQAEYPKAIGFTDHIRRDYDEAANAAVVGYTNHDPLCFSLHWAGTLVEWITGRPDTALESVEQAVAIADRLAHPFNSAFALTAGCQSLIEVGQAERLLDHCERVARIAAEEALGPFAERVLVGQWRGMALIDLGQMKDGHRLLKDGNDFWNESGGRVCNALFWTALARGAAGCGQLEEAEQRIKQAIGHCRRTGDRWMEPESLRVQADLVLQRDASAKTEALRLLTEAMSLAQAQGAHSWFLRAAMDNLRLAEGTKEREAARETLAKAIEAIEGGANTRDIRVSKSLLEQS